MWLTGSVKAAPVLQEPQPFTFAVAADTRYFAGPGQYDTGQYFRGVLQAIQGRAQTAFLVMPGDIDPPAGIDWTVAQVMGVGYPWFPVVGNHEAETPEDMAWLRSYDYSAGGAFALHGGPAGCPETTYSFDYANAHFVVLNEYCDAGGDTLTNGDVTDHLYNWLASNLAASDQPVRFVFGHEPAFPQPDADNGRLRHETDSLNAHAANRDRFWSLLDSQNVSAYFTGHTHNYSLYRQSGVWQVDVAHARGEGDSGARSTFVLVRVQGSLVTFETYRANDTSTQYLWREQGRLSGWAVYLPLLKQ